MRRRGPAREAAAIALGLALALGAPAAVAAQAITVVIDDAPVALVPPPLLAGGVLFLPLRPLARLLQCTVRYADRAVEIRRADGAAFALRLDRSEVWSSGLVVAVLPAPVRAVAGVTMIPLDAVEAVFDALAIWDSQSRAVTIVTRRPFVIATSAKPPSLQRARSAAPPFEPEFRPDLTPPLLASGLATIGVGHQGKGLAAAVGVQFRATGGARTIRGQVGVGAGAWRAPGAPPLELGGVVTIETPSSALTVGELSIDDSPLTLFEQGLIGGLYRMRRRGYDLRLFGGAIAPLGGWVYGATVTLPPVGTRLLGGVVLVDPSSDAVVALARAERPVAGRIRAFGELAAGTSALGFGVAWRAGVTLRLPAVAASLSYVSLGPRFPTVGNAGLFAARHGPLVQVAYAPDPRWLLVGSAALLRGSAPAMPARTAYSLLVTYRADPSWGFVGGVRSVADAAAVGATGITTVDAGAFYTRGPWTVVLSGRHQVTRGPGVGPAVGETAVALRASRALVHDLPVWTEVTRVVGATDAWMYGAGMTIRLSPGTLLSVQARRAAYALPLAYAETVAEAGLTRPFGAGALLALGGGVRRHSALGTTPYLSLQYGFPFAIRGPLRAGGLAASVFHDLDGNGRRDPGEPGVAGVVVRIDGQTAGVSDAEGRVAIARLRESAYRMALDEDSVPTGLVAVEGARAVRVVADQTAVVEFPLVAAASVAGVVYLDENANGRRDPGERGVAGVAIRLGPGDAVRTTEADGAFEFTSLRPGVYTLAIDPRSVPDGLSLNGNGHGASAGGANGDGRSGGTSSGHGAIAGFTLRPGAALVVEFALRPRPVKQTFP